MQRLENIAFIDIDVILQTAQPLVDSREASTALSSYLAKPFGLRRMASNAMPISGTSRMAFFDFASRPSARIEMCGILKSRRI